MSKMIFGYRIPQPPKTTIRFNESKEGETIEAKVRRINQMGEPITDGSPTYYTDREQGVLPEFNIRTEWIDLAVEAGDRNVKEKLARREETIKARKTGGTEGEQAPVDTEK